MDLPSETRVPPPSWINREFIETALRTAEHKKITVDSVNVQYANPEGVGYASLMFRLSAFVRYKDNEETQKKTLIVKTVLESGELKKLVEKCDVFGIEAEMLHDVMQLVHEQLAALEGEEFRPLAAQCYQWGRQPADFLVLEDLSVAGFRLAQAGQPLDLKHCAVTLRAYARLHAASAYVLSKHPQYMSKFSFDLYMDKTVQQHLESIGTKFVTALADEFEKCPGYEQYSERYRAFAVCLVDMICKTREKITKQTKLAVLTHGDCWKNNMMFKYVNGEVSEVRLVDFQVSSVASPASDLVYFLYANASEEVHRLHMEELLSEYHSSLVALLRRLGMEEQAEAYTLQELKKDIDHCLPVALYYATISGMVLTSEKYGAEYAKAMNDPNKMGGAVVKALRNPYTLSYMKYLSPIFVSKGIL